MADSTETVAEPRSGGAATAEQGRPGSSGASRAIEDAKKLGNELLAAAYDGVTALADEQRMRAADQIAAVGEALRRSAESLERDGMPVGCYVDQAAGRVGEFAQTVRKRSWAQFGTDIEDFARTWPMTFAATALGVGFLAGRFLLAAPPRAADERPQHRSAVQKTGQDLERRGDASHDAGIVSSPISDSAPAGYRAARDAG